MTKTIVLEDIEKEFDVEISWKFSGKYYPATRETPEEFPDFEWEIEEATDTETGEKVADKALLQKIEDELAKISSDLECKAGEIENDRRDEERNSRYPDDED